MADVHKLPFIRNFYCTKGLHALSLEVSVIIPFYRMESKSQKHYNLPKTT